MSSVKLILIACQFEDNNDDDNNDGDDGDSMICSR
jgi:hypothetical protein